MRKYLVWRGLYLKRTTKYILIPPRATQAKAIAAWETKKDTAGLITKALDIITVFLKTGTVKGILEDESAA